MAVLKFYLTNRHWFNVFCALIDNIVLITAVKMLWNHEAAVLEHGSKQCSVLFRNDETKVSL